MSMKVAFYTPWIRVSDANVSGDVTLARGLIDALEHRGHEVRVISEVLTKRFSLHPRRLRRLARGFRQAHRVARDFRPDVWLTFVSQRDAPDLFGPTLARRFRVPYVLYQVPHRGDWKALRMKEGNVRHLWSALPGYLLNLFALFSADRVIANKMSDYERHGRRPGLRSRLSLIWPAVSLTDFRPDSTARSRLRTDLGLDDETCLILSVARLDDKKGRKKASTRFLIDCVRDLVAAGEPVRLAVVGDGKARAELEDHARDLGNSVTFVGWVAPDEVGPWYQAADVFAYPGLREPIGMVYLEAQASLLPVVAFRNYSIPHIVLDGETGLLADPMDRTQFVECLRRLVRDPGLRRAMGQAGRAHVAQHHELDAWGAQLEEALTAPGKSRLRRPA